MSQNKANSAPPRKFWKTLVAGGIAGSAEICIMYPTDVIKTRHQLKSGAGEGMITTFKNILKNEGTPALYRGIISPIFAEAPKRAIKFSANEKYKKITCKKDGSLNGFRAGIAGAMAGMSEVVVNCPFEVVKVRMQAKEAAGLYKSTGDCAMQLLKKEGPIALYRGAEPQLWRNAAWNGVYFGLIGSIRSAYPMKKDVSNGGKLFYNFCTGVVGGTIATVFNTPFDVIKSRMQNQGAGVAKYVWTIPSAMTIVKEEGVRALYKGFGPRIVRLGPGGGIMLVAFDFISKLLERF
eukprot:TRINITY_DN484_c0_g1_i1.p1 TRINITY_DN484_c0_g1~~TRINITY_DN484_c0_g1_i1.p1  ORF type:complete len:293 (-),score=93.42 TRINITY_DN484_c0_g1_i1:800-1678(-)